MTQLITGISVITFERNSSTFQLSNTILAADLLTARSENSCKLELEHP